MSTSNQSSTLPKAIFIMGPTASGKTDLAVALRRHLPVDIINVDSAQIYRQLDIGSAKPDPAILREVPHRLMDIRDPAQVYSAADFVVDARRAMSEIAAQGRVPLLVGGSMMYFKLLLEGLSNLPEADQTVRDKLQQRADKQGWAELYKELQQVDPQTASRLHPNHSQRIQRALEVYQISGTPMSQLQRHSEGGVRSSYHIYQFALTVHNRSLLHQRIERRFKAMMAQGFESEVQKLYQRGDLNPSMPAIRSVGYRQLWDYFSGQCSLDEAVAKAIVATRQLAKRQMTWLRNWPQSIEIAVDNQAGYLATEEICNFCLKKVQPVPI